MAERTHLTAASQYLYWRRFRSLAAAFKTKLDKWKVIGTTPLSIDVGTRVYEDCRFDWSALCIHWDRRPCIVDGIYRRFDDGLNVLPFERHELVLNAKPVIEEILLGFRFERLASGDCRVLRRVSQKTGRNFETLVNLLDPFQTGRKDVATPNRGVKRQRKRQQAPRPLTAKQIEASKLHGECKGNIAEVARRMGIGRKTAEQHVKTAFTKVGKSVPTKAKTISLKTDRRGQVDVAKSDDNRG